MKLRKPIKAHGEEITEINFREVTGGDVIDLGQPMSMKADESMDFKMDVVAKYIVALAQIPMTSVREMHPSDLFDCAVEISSFFGE